MVEDFKVLINEEALNKRVEELADEISKDYNKEEIILICVLKGSVYFVTDLSKKIKNNIIILDFMKVSSYGVGERKSTGKVDFKLDLSEMK